MTTAPAAPVRPVPAPAGPTRKPPKTKRAPASRKSWGNTLIGVGAAGSVLAVTIALFQPWQGDGEAESVPPPAPAVTTPSESPTVSISPAVSLVLEPPKDNGTTVSLKWRSSKPLTYVVFVAEQGGKAAQASFKRSGTSLTVAVTPGLKYCFEVQGTDGTTVYESGPVPIRGAACKS